MPKRTNVFQEVISILQEHMAEGATVERSGMLVHRVTGQKREVDVVIRRRVGAYEVIVSVEATAIGRKADTGWVEKMIEKHRNLPTSKLVLVSQAGFWPAARQQAEAEYVAALAPEDLDVDDPAFVVVNALPSLWPKFLSITPETITVVVRTPAGVTRRVRQMPFDAHVFLGDSGSSRTLLEVFDALYKANFAKSAEQIGLPKTTEDIDRFFVLTIGPPLIVKQNGQPIHLYLQWEETDPPELHEIQMLDLRGKATVRVGEIPLHHRRLGEITFSYGQGKIGSQSVLLVVSEDEGGGKATMRFGPEENVGSDEADAVPE